MTNSIVIRESAVSTHALSLALRAVALVTSLFAFGSFRLSYRVFRSNFCRRLVLQVNFQCDQVKLEVLKSFQCENKS